MDVNCAKFQKKFDSRTISRELPTTTFRKVRKLLLGSYDDGDISEDEFLLLHDANSSKNPDFPYQNYEHFDLEELDENECWKNFVFKKGHTCSRRGNEIA